MKPKKIFRQDIENYYSSIASDQIPSEFLVEIIDAVCANIYTTYKRFWKQYPKSRKRYSTLKLVDLEHPNIFDLIIRHSKKLYPNHYKTYCSTLFKMSIDELSDYEQRRKEFHQMF